MSGLEDAVARWLARMARLDAAVAAEDIGPLAYTSASEDATTELLLAAEQCAVSFSTQPATDEERPCR